MDLIIFPCTVVFIVATTVYLRRAHYSWPVAGLLGLSSPLLFVALYRPSIRIMSMLAGRPDPGNGIPADVGLLAAYILVNVWCIAGFLLSQRVRSSKSPAL